MVRISEEEAKRLGLWEYCPKPEKPEKERKYHNKPCEYKGPATGHFESVTLFGRCA